MSSMLHRRHFELMSKYNVVLKIFLQEDLSKPLWRLYKFYKFIKIVGKQFFFVFFFFLYSLKTVSSG